jgi:hypothetical protein
LRRFCNIIFALLIAIFGQSCNNKNQSQSANNVGVSDSLVEENQLFITYKNTVFCVPSPQQMNLYIKHLGVIPNKNYVNPFENVTNYNSSFKKALNLGVYGADIGYINTFLPSDQSVNYFMSVKQLANGLDIGYMINDVAIYKLKSSYQNHDSLLRVTSEIYKASDKFLKENSREDICALIVAGGWVETVYILSSHYADNKNKSVVEIIGQQKHPLEFVIKVLAPYYKTSTEISDLVDDLVDLAYSFDAIDNKYEYSEPICELENGVYCINNSCELRYTEKTISDIVKKITSIRNKVIQ